MGRKKALVVNQAQEPFELKPFCYYCDREFDTAKTLIQHQRTKHFNCAECGLKFDTVTGLRVHMLNAYKKTMKEVPNAMQGRENPDIVVHGMEGLPKGVLEEKTRKALAERAERERIREEESKERNKALFATRVKVEAAQVANNADEEEEEEAPVAPGSPETQTRVQPDQPPAATAPAPQHSSQAPPNSGHEQKRPQAHGIAQLPQAMMQNLSPAVARLLTGNASTRNGSTGPDGGVEGNGTIPGGLATVPGLPGHAVPSSLAGLHPVALQVLMFAGALLPSKTSITEGSNPLGTAHVFDDGKPRMMNLATPAMPGPMTMVPPNIGVGALPQPGPGTAFIGLAGSAGLGAAPLVMNSTPLASHVAMGGHLAMGVGSLPPIGGAAVMGNVNAVGLAGTLGGVVEPEEKRMRLAMPG